MPSPVTRPGPGDGYGAVVVPSVGQEVVIGYVDGEPAAPVVLGQLFNGTTSLPAEPDTDGNTVRAFVTPGGHAIVLDDSSEAAVSITSAAGSTFTLDDAGGTAKVVDGGSGNSVTLSSDGIVIEAAQGDIVLKASGGAVKIDALTFEGKASGPSSLESSATFDLKASGPLGLQGALVNIN